MVRTVLLIGAVATCSALGCGGAAPAPATTAATPATPPATAPARDPIEVKIEKSSTNLRQIGLGIQNHHDTFFQLPANVVVNDERGKASKALLSWRVAILPYIGQDELYKKFRLNEPWDSETNKSLIPLMPSIYAPVNGPAKPGETYYQMFTGRDAVLQDPNKGRMNTLNYGVITDGTSNTFAVVEAGKPVIWTKPDDIAFDEKAELSKLGGEYEDGFHAVMLDGQVFFVSRKVDAAQIKSAITPQKGEITDTEKFTRRFKVEQQKPSFVPPTK